MNAEVKTPGVSVLYSGATVLDNHNLHRYVNNITKAFGLTDIEIDENAFDKIVNKINGDFPHSDGVEQASIFKKAAYFLTHFISSKPIITEFKPEHKFIIGGYDLSRIKNAQNAAVGYLFAIDLLHGAVIHREDGSKRTLDNRIGISAHSFIDIIDTLSNITIEHHWKFVSVFLEQLAYKDNPDASYEVKI